MMLTSIFACATCADKVPNWVVVLIGSISLIVMLSFIVWKVIIKIRQVRRVKNNASV